MFDGKGIDYVNNSFKVFKADYLFTKRGYINRWRYKNGKHKATGYSDHLPLFAYFDTKPYKKQKHNKHATLTQTKHIEHFYDIETLEGKIKLEDAVVVLKRGRSAVVKQTTDGRGIFFYGCASKLKEGYKYDLLVDAIKTYKGLKEVTSAYMLKEKGKVHYEKFYRTANDFMGSTLKQNEIVTNIVGTYKNRKLYVNDKKIPIHFKKRKLTPSNGSKIKIAFGHLGYYKRLQLVVYNKKDFEVIQ